MKGPLTGIRILDLTHGIAGPTATMILGDLGAEIIKIEPPGGVSTRVVSGPHHEGESCNTLAYNRSKKDIVLDLNTEPSRQALYDLVKTSDALISNFRPGVMARLGADYETLKKLNSSLVYVTISGYGPSGPHAHRAATDMTASAHGGIVSLIGETGRAPQKAQPAIIDSTTGVYAAVGILAALRDKERLGIGAKIDLCLLDVTVSLLGHIVPHYTLGGGVQRSLGSRQGNQVPFGVYDTRDGYIALGPCWPQIAHALGKDELTQDVRFSTPEARVQYQEELNSILGDCLLQKSTEDWLGILYAEDIQVAPVNTVDKVVGDAQVNHNHMILTLPHPLGGEIKVAGNPIKISGYEDNYLPPPTLGQNTEEVLSKLLGYDAEKIRLVTETRSGKIPSQKSRFRGAWKEVK